MTVRAPLSTTTEPQVAAASTAAARRASSSSARSPSSAGWSPLPARSRANSPACGVRTAGRRSPVPPAVHRGHRPERLGVEHERGGIGLAGDRQQRAHELGGGEPRPQARARRRSRRARGRGSGPCAGSGSTSSTSSSGSAIVVASTTLAAKSGWSDSGTASVTRPTPAPPGRAADEQGRAGVVERAGDDEQLPERALVAAGRPLRDEGRRRCRRRASCAPVGNGAARIGRPARSPRSVASAEADRPRSGTRRPSGVDRLLGASEASAPAPPATAVARRRSIRARMRRSRSSSRSSMSGGKTYRPPAVRTPNAMATA